MSRALRSLKKRLPGSRWLVIAVPYIWMLLFFAIPLAIAFKISFSQAAIAMPPYTPLLVWIDGHPALDVHLKNYLYLIKDSLYVSAYLSSIKIAVISTFLCLLIGYPMAYAIARMDPATRNIALMLVVLPSWTSFLIRIYAWIGILKNNGLLNNFLMWTGVIDEPLAIMHTPIAVYIGIVYAYPREYEGKNHLLHRGGKDNKFRAMLFRETGHAKGEKLEFTMSLMPFKSMPDAWISLAGSLAQSRHFLPIP